jgi:hypothetical protein
MIAPATVAVMGWRAGTGWIAQAQLLAITALGMVVLIPFAMAAGVVMLVAAVVLLGPIGLMRFLRRGAEPDPGAADHGAGPPSAPGR